jgi:hypothetical protein
MDADMRELMDVLGTIIVPRHKRKTVSRENLHAPYYSRNRYKRVA